MADPRRESKRRRFEIFERDRFTCQYCGQNPPAVVLEIDHIVAISEGGLDSVENLVTACQECNRGKAARSIDEASIPLDYEKLAEQSLNRAEQMEAYRAALSEYRVQIETSIDFVGASFFEPGQTFSPGSGWRPQVERFIELLGLGEVDEAARISRAKVQYGSWTSQFKYFCAICWLECTDRGIRGDGKER